MKNRVVFLLCLDTAMLLLVCVLECINFTGLQWHQWLGFAFCPVVLWHVVMQWPWFSTQFQRMRTPGAWRVRVNAGLNLLLLGLMASVLFSGGFVSAQGVESLGESFGQVRIWSEVHGWLNFVLVVLVGLHLALNWDWMLAALRRHRPERPADASPFPRSAAVPAASSGGVPPLSACAWPSCGSVTPTDEDEARRLVNSQARTPALPIQDGPLECEPRRSGATDASRAAAFRGVGWMRSLGRAVAVLLVSSLAAGTAYFTIAATLSPGKRAAMNHQRAAAKAKGLAPNLAPRNRPISMRRAPSVAGTLALTVGVAVIGRYVFRLRS